MTEAEKARQLRKYKTVATLLFLFMAVTYAATYWLSGGIAVSGYLRAFAEAAMVGALADWFAVVALFRHPLGLPIPHTNLIEGSKSRIGDNLGHFITGNFLTSAAIRPRIEKLHIAEKLGAWLSRPANRARVVTEILRIIKEGIAALDDTEMQRIITKQATGLLDRVKLHVLAGDLLQGIVRQGIHEEWITLLAQSAAQFIEDNADTVKQKVKEESHFLVPGFVDNIIAAKITKGAATYLRDLAIQNDHSQRARIADKLLDWAARMKTDTAWAGKFQYLKDNLLSGMQVEGYAEMLWLYLKKQMLADLSEPSSSMGGYLDKTMASMASVWMTDGMKQQEMDRFVQAQAFKLILRHRQEVAALISNTVGNWKGRELSEKLELEVGKDLQFIRLNGTLVGGLVGLLIYALTRFFAG